MTTYLIMAITKEELFYSHEIRAESHIGAYLKMGAYLGEEIAGEIVGYYHFNVTALREDAENDEEYHSDYESMILLSIEVCKSFMED